MRSYYELFKKELPISERPRERFKKYGVGALSNEELLSILLRTGTSSKSVKDLSLDILRKININDLVNYDFNTLKDIKGVGEVKAITILSAIEFGKRALSKKDLIKQIKTGDDVFYLVKDEMENSLQEKFLVICLDAKKFVISKKVIFTSLLFPVTIIGIITFISNRLTRFEPVPEPKAKRA